MEDTKQRASAAKMYKRRVLSYSKHLKYKQGEEDIKRERSVDTEENSRYKHEFR